MQWTIMFIVLYYILHLVLMETLHVIITSNQWINCQFSVKLTLSSSCNVPFFLGNFNIPAYCLKVTGRWICRVAVEILQHNDQNQKLPVLPFWFNNPNNIRWREHITKLNTMQLFPLTPCSQTDTQFLFFPQMNDLSSAVDFFKTKFDVTALCIFIGTILSIAYSLLFCLVKLFYPTQWTG